MAPSVILSDMATGLFEPELPRDHLDTPHLAPKSAAPSLPTQPIKQTSSSYVVNEEPIRTRRPLRVVCMGAGYSGLMMAMVFSEKLQDSNAEFVIYERNADLGGTWLENRYYMLPLQISVNGYLLTITSLHETNSLYKIIVILDVNATFQHTTMHTPSNLIQNGPIIMPLLYKFLIT